MLTPEQLANMRERVRITDRHVGITDQMVVERDRAALLDHVDALTAERDQLRATVERVRALADELDRTHATFESYEAQRIRAALNGDDQ